MVMGTGSDAGKSLIVAGLCRHFANRGYRIAPFKPQNMSNNAAVTEDGGEIGRAQALQARAARCALTVDLNPVLLKPQSEIGAQIVVQGKVLGSARAREFQDRKRALMPAVLESFGRLKAAHGLIIVEGAGSASEINLRKNDIANMGFAEAADVPVILVGDIDRGGVIASLVGTKHVLAPGDAARIEGFIVNKMRGDPGLFEDGMAAIASMTGWRRLGLVPHFPAASRLPAEDAFSLHASQAAPAMQAAELKLKIAVPLLPYISNFDDLDPLRLEPGVSIEMVARGKPLPLDAGVILLPGSKATIADLETFRAEGWDIDLAAYVRRGGYVLGLCGGFQMLGREISDPYGVEGPPQTVAGLGLLDISTTLTGEKALRQVRGTAYGAAFDGYEMHMGVSGGAGLARPLLHLDDGRAGGTISADGRIAGCYVHGLFASDAFRQAWLASVAGPADEDPLTLSLSPRGERTPELRSSLGREPQPAPSPLGERAGVRGDFPLAYSTLIEQTLDELAAHLARHIDLDTLLRLMR
jgi:adenosylcobyric acid synthase